MTHLNVINYHTPHFDDSQSIFSYLQISILIENHRTFTRLIEKGLKNMARTDSVPCDHRGGGPQETSTKQISDHISVPLPLKLSG